MGARVFNENPVRKPCVARLAQYGQRNAQPGCHLFGFDDIAVSIYGECYAVFSGYRIVAGVEDLR